MKNFTLHLSGALLVAVALSLAPAHRGLAQDQEQHQVVPIKDADTVQKSASGNITDITPYAIFIKSVGDTHPTAYIVTGDTSYVDDQEAPSQKANAKIGHAVIISYVTQGDSRVALKVVVRNAP